MRQRRTEDAWVENGLAILMSTSPNYPFVSHPCFSNTRSNLWARIHLPVAPKCNVKCAFCTHGVGSSCHSSKPGFAAQVMSVTEAIATIEKELQRNPGLRIAAISGPGEPLANHETMSLFSTLKQRGLNLKLCLSTNGTLLREFIPELVDHEVSTISVSISAATPQVASTIYEWARLDGKLLTGNNMGEEIIERQLAGIKAASEAGIIVKVNSILMPNVNTEEIREIANNVLQAGASIHNIVPLVPAGNMLNQRPPTVHELALARASASEFIAQFTHCKQCRSDVVGIPGRDRIL